MFQPKYSIVLVFLIFGALNCVAQDVSPISDFELTIEKVGDQDTNDENYLLILNSKSKDFQMKDYSSRKVILDTPERLMFGRMIVSKFNSTLKSLSYPQEKKSGFDDLVSETIRMKYFSLGISCPSGGWIRPKPAGKTLFIREASSFLFLVLARTISRVGSIEIDGRKKFIIISDSRERSIILKSFTEKFDKILTKLLD